MAPSFIGVSQHIENMKILINQIAKTEENVLVLGEKGVGKDLVVQNLYHRSKRAGKPFVKINCALLAGTSLESQIFGYKPTPLNDLQLKTHGLLERIKGGVLFLDKIGEIPLALQAKFFKLLQSGHCFPSLICEKSSKADVWIIAAASCDLEKAVIAGKFRQDLFGYLSTKKILIEPLRKRPEDISCLIHHYVQQYAKGLNVGTIKGFKRKLLRRMVDYHWPGNVKELQSVVKRIMIFGDNEAAYQYRMPGLDDDFISPTDDLAIVDMSPTLSTL